MQFRLGKKLERDPYVTSMDQLRVKLESSIREETHRENVDAAKKRAVQQVMDYENFKQLVLGADLKPLKPAEIKDMAAADPFRPKSSQPNQNFQNAPPVISLPPGPPPKKEGPFDSYMEFKKKVETLKKKPNVGELRRVLQRIAACSEANMTKIVGADFDSQFLFEMIRQIENFAKDSEKVDKLKTEKAEIKDEKLISTIGESQEEKEGVPEDGELIIQGLVMVERFALAKNFERLIAKMSSRNEKALLNRVLSQVEDKARSKEVLLKFGL